MWIGYEASLEADMRVRADLMCRGRLTSLAAVKVDGDAEIGERLEAVDLTVTGTLTAPAGVPIDVSRNQRVGAVRRAPVDVRAPCDCSADALLDVAALVARHETDNDNAAAGFDPTRLGGFAGRRTVEVPCGRLYVPRLSGQGALTIVARQRTALFVAGDVTLTDRLTVQVADGGELDLFIAGLLSSPAPIFLGDAEHPSRVRLYLGGTGAFHFSGGSMFGGNLYAPRADLYISGPLVVFGSIFANALVTSPGATVHYDLSVLDRGADCGEPPPDQCMSCRDCGNQACIGGQCGACRTNADCCPPLFCVRGTCEPSQI